jgi:hypothetical protein
MLEELNNDYFAGYSVDTKYMIGISSGIAGAFCISFVFVTTRQLKNVHYSVI